MKKTYQIPATKAMRVSTENIMGMTAVSDGYEQGVSGDGSDKEARIGESSIFWPGKLTPSTRGRFPLEICLVSLGV